MEQAQQQVREGDRPDRVPDDGDGHERREPPPLPRLAGEHAEDERENAHRVANVEVPLGADERQGADQHDGGEDARRERDTAEGGLRGRTGHGVRVYVTRTPGITGTGAAGVDVTGRARALG